MPLTENVNVATQTKSYTVGEAMNPVVVITVKQVQKMPSNDLQHVYEAVAFGMNDTGPSFTVTAWFLIGWNLNVWQ